MALRVWKTEELTPLQAQVGGWAGRDGSGWRLAEVSAEVGVDAAATMPLMHAGTAGLSSPLPRPPARGIADAAAQGDLHRHPHLPGQARAGGAQGHD